MIEIPLPDFTDPSKTTKQYAASCRLLSKCLYVPITFSNLFLLKETMKQEEILLFASWKRHVEYSQSRLKHCNTIRSNNFN